MANPIPDPDPHMPDYFKEYYPQNLWSWIVAKIFSILFWLMRLLVRWVKRIRIPIPPVNKYVLILGFDLFQEVFTRWQDFPVPHDDKTKPKAQGGVGWEPPFLLARPDNDAAYQQMHQNTRDIFFDHIDPVTNEKFINQFPDIAKNAYDHLLDNRPPGLEEKIDLGWEYTYPGFLTIFEDYFGIRISTEKEQVEFVCALLVVSGFFFSSAKASTNASKVKNAQDAFDFAWALVLKLVQDAKANPGAATGALGYAIGLSGLTDDDLTSYFLGMMLGSVPTNGNAHARVLEVLLKNEDAKSTARYYAEPNFHVNKDVNFLAVLHECLRLNYILPGLWRIANKDDLVIGESQKYELGNIKKDTIFLVSGMAGMHDPVHFPERFKFRSDRSYWSYMNYGHQMHFCVGWDMSNIMMREYFRALVVRKFQEDPTGKIKGRSMFPWKFDVLYIAR